MLPTESRGAGDPVKLANLWRLAHSLHEAGRARDALLLLEHLDETHPGDAGTLLRLLQLLSAEGQTLAAIEKLVELKAATVDMEALLGVIQSHVPAALQCFNDHLAASEIEMAERYASSMVALIPRNVTLLDAALS